MNLYWYNFIDVQVQQFCHDQAFYFVEYGNVYT